MKKLLASAAMFATLSLNTAGAAILESSRDNPPPTENPQVTGVRTLDQSTIARAPMDKKARLEGQIVEQQTSDRFVLRDQAGTAWTVQLISGTRIEERKSNPFRGAKKYSPGELITGLHVQVEGSGDVTGAVRAERIRFTNREMEIARTMETRVQPVERRLHVTEDRLGQTEQNARRLSDQVVELGEVSNMARGGARAAQDTADAAMAGIGRTNQRIAALDDYEETNATTVNFKVGSAVLTPEAKTQLDELAQQAKSRNGYLIEVAGFASSDGDQYLNQALSQSRADAVVHYLVDEHSIPLRRITMPYGYGTVRPVAENTTREGRQRNRRVEVRVLLNRGLTTSGTSADLTRPGSL